MTRQKTWALVMNGVHARILRGLETTEGGAPMAIETTSAAGDTHMRDHREDRSGRSFSSGAGGRRSAMEPGTDPVRRDMEDFARKTLEDLEKRHAAGEFERIAIVAAPKMMGILRETYPAGLRGAIFFEDVANLVSMPEEEIRAALIAMMRREAVD